MEKTLKAHVRAPELSRNTAHWIDCLGPFPGVGPVREDSALGVRDLGV